MNLFDILPERYFSIFSSKNRKIYADSLIILYEMLESDESVINKTDFVRTLKEKGKRELEALDVTLEDDYEVEENDETEIIEPNLADKASYVCRKLEQVGWFDVALDTATMEEIIILPVYSIYLIRAFKDIISDEESPYLSLVHATYSELRLEDDELDDMLYLTLNRCYENTRKLKIELITLSHSIRVYRTKLSRMFNTNDVLHDFLDIYKNKILDRYYHPLKTFDSVIKFKRPIINILEKWLHTKTIRDKIVMLGCASNTNMSREDVEEDVVAKINYITDIYSTIEHQIATIDKENSEYTQASTNKILYLNNADRTTKGYLENIFKHYAQNVNDLKKLGKILGQMQDSIFLYEQGYINSDSVTLPIIRKNREESDPMPIMDWGGSYEDLVSEFLESAKTIYPNEKIYEFMRRCFNGNDTLNVADIPLNTFEDFICLIFATVKSGEKDCFYYMEIVDNTKVLNGLYLVPNLVFHVR